MSQFDKDAAAALLASRTIGFALIGVVPQPKVIQEASQALGEAPEFKGADVALARSVLANLARGLLPSQRSCIAARGQLEGLRQAFREAMRDGQADHGGGIPAPRG